MANSLAKKLAEIMAEVGHVAKKGHNAFHNYDYVRATDMLDAVREKMAKAGIAVIPSVVSASTEPQGDGKLTSIWLEYTLVDSETGESLKASMPGQGWDKGDKGVYKAITGSLKYFVMGLFLVTGGDDPEADAKTDKHTEERPAPEGWHKAGEVAKTVTAPLGDEIWRNLSIIRKDGKRYIHLRGYCDDMGDKGTSFIFKILPNYPKDEPFFTVRAWKNRKGFNADELRFFNGKHVLVHAELVTSKGQDYLNYESGAVDARGDEPKATEPTDDDPF